MEPAESNPDQLQLDLWPDGGQPLDLKLILDTFAQIEKQRKVQPTFESIHPQEYKRRWDDLLRRGLL